MNTKSVHLFGAIMLFFASVSSGQAFNDYGSFTGNQKAIGNDKALEAGSNPAYLSFPKKNTTVSAAVKEEITYYININNPLFEQQTPSNVMQFNTIAGVSFHNLFPGFHMGLYFDNASPHDFGDQPFYQIFQARLPTGSTQDSSSVAIDLSENYYKGAIALAYNISNQHSFGINFFYGSTSRMLSKNINIQFTDATLTPGTITHSESATATGASYGAYAGYVNQTDFGELSINIKPFHLIDYDMQRELNFNYTLGGVPLNTTGGTFNYAGSIYQPILLSAGFSQEFLGFLKVYLEGSVTLPSSSTETTYELEYYGANPFPQVYQFSILTESQYIPEFKAGFNFKIPEAVEIYLGGNIKNGSYSVLYSSPANSGDNIARQFEESTWAVQLGISASFFLNSTAYLGFSYSNFTSDVTESEYVNQTLTETTYLKEYSKITGTIGFDYAF